MPCALREYPAIQYNSPDGSLQKDILSKLGGAFSFEDLQFEGKYYEGVRVPVATPETLYRMIKDTGHLSSHQEIHARCGQGHQGRGDQTACRNIAISF
jgi:hypothetical protein